MPPLIQWVFVIFGAWLVYLNVTGLLEMKKNLRFAKESVSWPSVMGRVVSATISEGKNRGEAGTYYTYRPDITYSYTVGGTEFKSSRLAFGKILYNNTGDAENFKQTYGEGGEVQVFHDPSTPKESVLDRDPKHATKLVIADCFMGIAGLAMFISGLVSMLT